MDTDELAAIGYAVTAAVYTFPAIILLLRLRHSRNFLFLAIAMGASLVWSGVLAAQIIGLSVSAAAATWLELARCFTWLAALVALLRYVDPNRYINRARPAFTVFVLLLLAIPAVFYIVQTSDGPWSSWRIFGCYLLSLLIIFSTEQLFRNALVDSTSGLNYFCVALFGVFLYDLILYGLVIAGAQPRVEYWAARGYVNFVFAAPLVLGIWRTFRISFDVQFSRQIVVYLFGLSTLALFVVIAIAGQYYLQTFGGSWGEVAGIVLVVAMVAALAVTLASASTRARARVFLMKTFFQFKYDYRKEWLRFIATLSESGLENVAATAVRAVAQIVNSPGGTVWTKDPESSTYLPAGSWRCAIPDIAPIAHSSPLIEFLQNRQWVIDLEEMRQYPDRYAGLQVDDWLRTEGEWWLIVPIFLGKRLYGLIVLKKPRVVPSLNFEDHDLLRTVGRHVGMHINQAESDNRLAESRQFGAYNRLTAFLMHDLNNLIAQQSLVVKNAERFRDNPKFVDDAISTIANSVSRMTRLMKQLSSGSKTPATQKTNLHDVLANAVQRSEALTPKPRMIDADTSIDVLADPERLTTVFEHLIRNAQDATEHNGKIEIGVVKSNQLAIASISDTGEGMSSDFIRERLFRPFDSTKGSHAMGIGVYQARDYIRSLGGQIEVTSELGVGTTFIIRLPVESD